jgi:phenolic acid decarboxylase
MMKYDYIVVGGGIAGMTTAHRLAMMNPSTKICLVEKEDRLGGRLFTEKFHGFRVPHGGSMIRGSDTRVFKLCSDLGLEVRSVEGHLQSDHPDFVNNMLREIAIKSEGVSAPMTVERFLRETYPTHIVNKFLENSIYRDFLGSDLSEFIRTYPVSDLLQPEGIFNQPYVCKGGFGALVDALTEKLKSYPKVTVILDTEVIFVKEGWEITLSNKNIISSKNLIWATTIDSATELLPQRVSSILRKHIEGVSFLRAAGYVDGDFNYSKVVGGLLGKLFSLKGGVFQLAYTEDQAADSLNRLLSEAEGRSEGLVFLNKLLSHVAPGYDLKDYTWTYWKTGIHQFKIPVRETLNKFENGLWLVGEMVALENKGWVEGALQSVDEIFPAN